MPAPLLRYLSSFSRSPPHPHLHSFPTRRSSDLTARHLLRHDVIYAREGLIGHAPAERKGEQLPLPRIQALERSEEHTSELQSQSNLVCRLLLEKKKQPATAGQNAGSAETARAAI